MSRVRTRPVPCGMFVDPRFRALTSAQKNVFLYLLAGPQTDGVPGLHTFSPGKAAEDLGLGKRAVEVALGRFVELALVSGWDPTTHLVWREEGIHEAPPRSAANVQGFSYALSGIPSCALRDAALDRLRAYCDTRGPDFRAAIDSVGGAKPRAKPTAKPPAKQGAKQGASEGDLDLDGEGEGGGEHDPAGRVGEPAAAAAAARRSETETETETERRARDGEARVRAAMSAQSMPAKLRAGGEPLVCELVSALDDSPIPPEQWGWACTFAVEHWSERKLVAPRMLVRVLVEDIVPTFGERFSADRRTFGEREVARLARHEEQDARRRAELAAEREAALAREQESYQATRQGDESIDAWRKRRMTEAHARYATLRRPTFDVRAPYVTPARRALTEDDDDGDAAGDDLSEAAS